MKTNALIALLATDSLQEQMAVRQRLFKTVLIAAVLSAILVVTLLGVNPALRDLVGNPAFIAKMIWLAALVAWSLWGLMRLARPGLDAGAATAGVALAVLCMLGLGAGQWLLNDTEQHMALWMGSSWDTCSIAITALSLPVLGLLLWALRQLAPTRPTLAGTWAGVLSGSLAAVLYSLHCPETSLTFYAIWYVAGMAMSTLLGAVLGSRLLRW